MTDKEMIRSEVERMIQARRKALEHPCFTGRERADMVTEAEVLGNVRSFIDRLPSPNGFKVGDYITVNGVVCEITEVEVEVPEQPQYLLYGLH